MSQTRVTRAAMYVAIALAVFRPIDQTVHAQSMISDTAIDNFRHPPDTTTLPLGKLPRVTKHGTGPIPIILVPGAAFGGSIWEDFMSRNADAYTMYAVTPPGYEGTKPPPWPEKNDFSDHTWTNALCNGIVALIDDEKLNRPVIVGHHLMGDHYALKLALQHPGKFRGVVVIAGMPSMAIPAFGTNQPGKPAKTASPDQRTKAVHSYYAPFYKNMTQKMWNAGTYQPRALCRDATRAAQLYDQQVSVPLPTQLRYFFEFETTDLEPELSKLSVPLLVVIPKREWTLETVLDNFKESNDIMYGDREKAKAAWTKNLIAQWGDVDEGIRWQWDPKFRWERLRGAIPTMTIHYVDDSGIFVMEDQPRVLTQEMRTFVEKLR